MLEAYCKLITKLKTSAELKEALQVIWGNLGLYSVDVFMMLDIITRSIVHYTYIVKCGLL